MNTELLKARLNLHVVLRNLEDLPDLDPGVAELTRDWRTTVQFCVRGGLGAALAFRRAMPPLLTTRAPHTDVKLFYFSPAHLKRHVPGTSNPYPSKVSPRLNFLKNEFTELTRRLEHFLRPDPGKLSDPAYLKVNTLLTLYTGVFAAKPLVELDPVAAQLAAATPKGSVQFVVDSNEPMAHIVYGDTGVEPQKGGTARPSAIMRFADWSAANRIITGGLDAFSATGKGLLCLEGNVPIIDNTGLIMDRVTRYLA